MPALVLLLLALFAPLAQAAEPPVIVCFDEKDRTPYVYRNARDEWRGAVLALTRAAIERAGLNVQWRPLPWLRCLHEVEDFEGSGSAEMAVYASSSPERERVYLFSPPLHRIHGGVWYMRGAVSPEVRTLADLGRYRLCGQHGLNYGWLLEQGVRTIDTGALSLGAALEKMQRGRCAMVLSALESVRGAAQLGFINLPPEAEFLPFPGPRVVHQHALVSRRSPRAQELLSRFSRALLELQASGESSRIYREFLPDGTGL